jgi:hypothetical protein
MNVFAPHRVTGRLIAGGLLLAACAAGAVAAGPAALASPSAAGGLSSAGVGSAETVGAGTITWSVIPSSATEPDSRARFSYTNIKPGSTITDHVAILNRSAQSVAFSVYATDATGTTASGALTLMTAAETPRDIGSWVTLPKGIHQLSIIIPGGKGIIEAFKITVPRHATPGDHTGGMIGSVSINRTNSKGQIVREDQRIAVPIDLRVAGPLHAGLAVESISTGFHSPLSPFAGGSATISYTVHNTGNIRLTGSQLVSVTGPLGIASQAQLKSLPTILPGDSVRFSGQASGLYPLGPMTAHIRLSPAIPAGTPPLALPSGYVTGTASLFAAPWSLLGLIILLIAVAVTGLRGRGWQRRRLRTKLDAAATSARLETEKRLLGNKGNAAGPQQSA